MCRNGPHAVDLDHFVGLSGRPHAGGEDASGCVHRVSNGDETTAHARPAIGQVHRDRVNDVAVTASDRYVEMAANQAPNHVANLRQCCAGEGSSQSVVVAG